MTAVVVGKAYTLSGRTAEAVPLLTQALAATRVTGRLTSQTLIHLTLGEALLLAGRLEEARGYPAYALRLLGDIAAHRDPPDGAAAVACYQEALMLGEALGMRPLQAHCHRSLGTLYAMRSQQEPARAELSTAMEMYRTMEMTFWLPQVEAVLAQVG